jgi:MFS family permease
MSESTVCAISGRSLAILLYAVFFASGVSALIFETLWFRQAGLTFGNTVWASSLVLSSFMGGLALGNALSARFGDRLEHPLLVYSMAEVALALTGVGLVYFLPGLGVLLTPWFRPLLDHPWILNPLRLLIAFVVLLMPSTAMGVTLPVLTKTLAAYDSHFGAVLGRLYGWNTLGAVTGAIVGEVYLVALWGVRGTALAAGALNLLSAAVAAWLSTRLASPAPNRAGRRTPPPGDPGRRWLAVAFLSGLCLLAVEVIWFRVLLLVVLGHSMAFTLMLGIVLAGMALGSLAASRGLRLSPSAYRHSAAIAFLAGMLTLGCYAAFPLVIAHSTPI